VFVDVSPFPFGGILFQVNQPLGLRETNLQAGSKWQNFVSILGALFGQDGGSTGKRGAVPHLVMENLVFHRSVIRNVSCPQSKNDTGKVLSTLGLFHLSNYVLIYILCYSFIMLLGGA